MLQLMQIIAACHLLLSTHCTARWMGSCSHVLCPFRLEERTRRTSGIDHGVTIEVGIETKKTQSLHQELCVNGSADSECGTQAIAIQVETSVVVTAVQRFVFLGCSLWRQKWLRSTQKMIVESAAESHGCDCAV